MKFRRLVCSRWFPVLATKDSTQTLAHCNHQNWECRVEPHLEVMCASAVTQRASNAAHAKLRSRANNITKLNWALQTNLAISWPQITPCCHQAKLAEARVAMHDTPSLSANQLPRYVRLRLSALTCHIKAHRTRLVRTGQFTIPLLSCGRIRMKSLLWISCRTWNRGHVICFS